MKKALLMLVVFCITSLSQAASPPDALNYQGVLRDNLGKPENGAFDMRFTFYNADTGGDEILIDAHTGAGAVSVSNGLFSVKLGTGTKTDGSGPGSYTLLSNVFRDYQNVWVKVTIGSEELDPRIRVVASAYAFNADNLDGLDSTAFAGVSHDHAGGDITSGIISETYIDATISRDTEVMPIVLANDGQASGLDADLLDGMDSSSFSATSHQHSLADGATDVTAAAYELNVLDGIGLTVTAANLTDLTDGSNADLLHTHNLSGTFLRKDIDDTAAGIITFSGSKTDIRGFVENRAPGENFVNFGDGLLVNGQVIAHTFFGNLSGTVYGGYIDAQALEIGNDCHIIGFEAEAKNSNDGTSTGTAKGLSGRSLCLSQGNNIGVFGDAWNGAQSYGAWFESDYTGVNSSVTNSIRATGDLFGVKGKTSATSTGNSMTLYGVLGSSSSMSSATGDHYGVVGEAMSPTGSGVHYGVYGRAAGGAANWGFFTPNDSFVGGKLALGFGAHDDLNAADVATLTGGGNADALHTHSFVGNFLRKDIDDTAAGVITFSAPTTDVRGKLVNNGVGETYVNVGENLDVEGMVVATHEVTESSGTAYGGLFSTNATVASNNVNVRGVHAIASGSSTSTGDYYALSGEAISSRSSGINVGVYGEARNTQLSFGGYFSSDHIGSLSWASSDTSTGEVTGALAAALASTSSNDIEVTGLSASAASHSTATGDHYGVKGTAIQETNNNGFHYGVYGEAKGGWANYGGMFTSNHTGVCAYVENYSDETFVAINGGTFSARAHSAGNNLSVYGMFGMAEGASDSTGPKYGVYGKSGQVSLGTNYGVYGTAVNGAVNWGLYTPDNANLGDTSDDRHRFSGWLQSGSSSDNHRVVPNAGNWGLIGDSSRYWYQMYANTYYGLNTAIQVFTPTKDADELEALRTKTYVDPKTGKSSEIFDPRTLPAFLKGEKTPDQPNGAEFVDMMKAFGFTLTKLKELNTKLNVIEDVVLGEDAGQGTNPAEETGSSDRPKQIAGGDRPVKITTRQAHDHAESVHVADAVEIGDVLVVDRDNPEQMILCYQEHDNSVVGVVTDGLGVPVADRSGESYAPTHEMRHLDTHDIGGRSANGTTTPSDYSSMAISGIVLCNVDASFGPIDIGDLLVTSTTLGHAMKSDAPAPGTIVGKALEPLADGTGIIRILVMLR